MENDMDSDITMRSYDGTEIKTANEPELPLPDKTWGKIFELARVGPYGPCNREERRRVDKVLRRLEKRGLTVG
jgi:hypothetical protein